jgi:hypothetical protein
MPTLLRRDGFDIRIYLDDHAPPHVHVFKAGGQAKIVLGSSNTLPELVMVQGMNAKDIKTAILIVTNNQLFLLKKWKEYHG